MLTHTTSYFQQIVADRTAPDSPGYSLHVISNIHRILVERFGKPLYITSCILHFSVERIGNPLLVIRKEVPSC